MRIALAVALIQGLLAHTEAYGNDNFVRGVDAIKAPFKSMRKGVAYADLDGPLNILRGYRLANDDMIAKKRMYTSPFRAKYTCEYNPASSDGPRNWTEYALSLLPEDSPATAYLYKYYAALEAMFDVVRYGDIPKVEKSSTLDTYFAVYRHMNVRTTLLSIMLVLAGGGDIQVVYEKNEYGDDTVITCRVGDYELLKIDKLALENAGCPSGAFSNLCAIIKFFHDYGGPRAASIAGYDLHYSDTPVFLAQAYAAEFFSEPGRGREILEAVDEILARRYDGGDLDVMWNRFFTVEANPLDSYSDTFEALRVVDSLALSEYRSPNIKISLSKSEHALFIAVKKRVFATEDSFGAVAQQAVKNFLGHFSGSIMFDHPLIAEVTMAANPSAFYSALTRWVACRPMRSPRDKLAVVDQLIPAFKKLLRSEQNRHDRRAYLSSHPLVIFITNVLGTMKDTKCYIADRFSELMWCYPAEYYEIFPCMKTYASRSRSDEDM
ncbi:hypothetical protein PAPHI01_2255 [Pancytospora philotis]|nr:hypothetical protein PAPHI01_2255 [Pancytospora philotis]